jgi:hypothetical protein
MLLVSGCAGMTAHSVCYAFVWNQPFIANRSQRLVLRQSNQRVVVSAAAYATAPTASISCPLPVGVPTSQAFSAQRQLGVCDQIRA